MRIILFVCMLMLSLPVLAQDQKETEPKAEPENTRPETIIVDRPSFANGSAVVGDGVASLETGILVTRDKGPGAQTLTQTPLLFRLGTSEELEFRLGSSGLLFQDDAAGWADLSPGFKWLFVNSDAAVVSLFTALNIPVGSRRFRNQSLAGTVGLAADFPLDDENGILINLGGTANGTTRNDSITGFATFGLAHTLSERSSIYFEVAGFTPAAPGEPSTMAGDIVVTYLVNNDLQLDVAAFKGFSSSGLDWGATFGVSTRF